MMQVRVLTPLIAHICAAKTKAHVLPAFLRALQSGNAAGASESVSWTQIVFHNTKNEFQLIVSKRKQNILCLI
jgi:hypothetical protein